MKIKKVIKLLLVLSLIIPTVFYATNNESMIVQAKVSGDYTYEDINGTSIQITNYNGSEKNLDIPREIDGKRVTKIGYGAFAECKSIETLVIPDTVTTIDAYAFSQCGQINTIVIPNSVVSMGRYAFAGNHSLKTIEIPNKIRSLGYGVFFDCISLTNILLPEGLQNIGPTAFGNCRALKSIKFPSTMISLENNAFSDCVMLESVMIPEGVTTLGSSTFSGCLSLRDIQLPKTLTSIGQSSFKDCISLEKIQLPENVTILGYALFSGCTSLKDVSIPKKVSSIGNAAFSGCSSLEAISIPDAVEEIGEYAFSGCTGLKEIYLPDSVEKIGASAFTYCASLVDVRLPRKLKKLEASIFRYCDSLESVVIPNGIVELGATVFADCLELKSVTFPNSIKTIGSRILSGSSQAVMLVGNGSTAHKYASNNNYKWRLLESGVNLDKDSLDMKVGDNHLFSVIIAPYTIIDNSQLKWKSSDPSIVSVDDRGKITALLPGIVTITVSNANGQSASAKVSVDDEIIPIEQVVLNYDSITMKKETSFGLRATITPNHTTMDRKVQWESDNTEIATVGSTGTIVARHPGTTKVRAITSNGKVAECEVTVISEIKSVSLNQTAMTLDVNEKQQLRAMINPSDTTDSKLVTWSSSNTKVASVDQNGEVTTLSEGTATITAMTVNGKRAECKITVVKSQVSIPIESVSLNQQTLNLEEGTSGKLEATINPANTTDDKTLNWSSSNEEIATVSNGTVTGLKEGTATIRVTTSNGKTAECIVTITKKEIPIESVSLNQQTLNLDEGTSGKLEAVINPANTTDDKTLNWSSSNEEVATVNNGTVTGLKEGTAAIRVTTSNGKTAECIVTVTKKEIPIEFIQISQNEATLMAKNQLQLSAVINPEETTEDKTLYWSSSDTTIASVDQNGLVSGHQSGNVVITVKTAKGIMDQCNVTVYEINKDQLKTLIDEAEKVEEKQYTMTSYQKFKSTLEKATLVYDNHQASQAEVDEITELLETEMNFLIERASELQLQQLSTLLEDCKKLQGTVDDADFQTMELWINEGEALLKNDHEDIAKQDVEQLQQKLLQEKDRLDLLGVRKQLKQMIDMADIVLNGDLSGIEEEKISTLKEARNNAHYLLDTENTDNSLLQENIETLKQAIANCKKQVEITHLNLLLELCESYDQAQYTDESWKAFDQALSEARKTIYDQKATQQQVDVAYKNLSANMMNLKVKVNTAMLEFYIDSANAILSHSNDYYSYSIKGLEALVNNAELLLNQDGLTSSDVNEMSRSLMKAIMNARLKGN